MYEPLCILFWSRWRQCIAFDACVCVDACFAQFLTPSMLDTVCRLEESDVIDTVITLNTVLVKVCVSLNEPQLTYLVAKMVAIPPAKYMESTVQVMRALGECSR